MRTKKRTGLWLQKENDYDFVVTQKIMEEEFPVCVMLNTKSKNLGIISIQKICDGLEISVRKFFGDPLFENPDSEIRNY